MGLLTGFLFGLILLIGYLIILECIKIKRLGKVLMKVKLDFIGSLSIAVILIGTILIILAIIYKFNQFNSSNIYGLSDKLVFGAMEAVYLMILARFFIGIICSREIREKGITLTKTNLNLSRLKSRDS